MNIFTENMSSSLTLMLVGMIGIFIVMLILIGACTLLNKFAKDKKDDEDKE